MTNPRSRAALMCFGAVMVFLTVMAASTERVSAYQCQEYCDAAYSAGQTACNNEFPGITECTTAVWDEYMYCSYGAHSCSGSFTCDLWMDCSYSSNGWTCWVYDQWCFEN
jgi:hypothetical protein